MSDAKELLQFAGLNIQEEGILIGQKNIEDVGKQFINKMKCHRHWNRKIYTSKMHSLHT